MPTFCICAQVLAPVPQVPTGAGTYALHQVGDTAVEHGSLALTAASPGRALPSSGGCTSA